MKLHTTAGLQFFFYLSSPVPLSRARRRAYDFGGKKTGLSLSLFKKNKGGGENMFSLSLSLSLFFLLREIKKGKNSHLFPHPPPR
jgi:hypothetical protein